MPIEVKGERLHVACGKCNFCLQNRRNEWAFRLKWEFKRSQTASFFTFTYDNEHVPLMEHEGKTYMTLNRSHLKRLHKSLKQAQDIYFQSLPIKDRKELRKKYRIKYYSVGEYGSRHNRPHYHSIIFNLHPEVFRKLAVGYIWKYGDIHRGDVTDASVQYTVKYVIESRQEYWAEDPRVKPFSMMSNGLGDNYLASRKKWHIDGMRGYCQDGEVKVRMPRYYKDRIFDAEQRKAIGEMMQENQVKNDFKTIIELKSGGLNSFEALETMRERINIAHDQVRSKAKKLDKL